MLAQGTLYYIFIIVLKNGWVRGDGQKGCDCYESYSGMAPIGKAAPRGLCAVPSHSKVVRVRGDCFERGNLLLLNNIVGL